MSRLPRVRGRGVQRPLKRTSLHEGRRLRGAADDARSGRGPGVLTELTALLPSREVGSAQLRSGVAAHRNRAKQIMQRQGRDIARVPRGEPELAPILDVSRARMLGSN